MNINLSLAHRVSVNSADLLATFLTGQALLPSRGPGTVDDIDWEALIRLAGRERILPALQGSIGQVSNLAQLPAEIRDFFSAVEVLNGERNLAIFKELATVVGLLNSVGIEPVLLKGAAYCVTGVYPNPAMRYMIDVDLLIPEVQLSSGVGILIENGFDWDRNDRLGCLRHHHPPLYRSGIVSFELHHSLGMGPCKSLLSAAEVLEQSSPLDFRGTRVRVPSPEHLTVHLIMHSQIQHPYPERIWPPLLAMYDLVLLRRRFDQEVEWKLVERRFRRSGQFGLLAMHLVQVRETLGGETPFPIHLTGLTYLRSCRRRLVRTLPALRFLDPLYLFSIAFVRRWRVLQSAFAVHKGWTLVVRELLTPGFFSRLLADIKEGP